MGRADGRSVLVTGATSGIGLATARLLRDEGARVVATGRRAESVEAARVELGVGVDVVRSDIADTADVEELVGLLRETRAGLDLVVVNAGITAMAAVEEVTPELYDRLFAVNTRGPYLLLQRLAPLIRAGGAVVVTTSVADEKGLAGSSVYAATKAALRSMVRSFARELEPCGVRVNAVSPGPIDTGILERSTTPEVAAAARAQMTAVNPMGRFGRPEEVAAAIAFLGLEATFTTGAELPVDGGASQL